MIIIGLSYYIVQLHKATDKKEQTHIFHYQQTSETNLC